MAWCQPCTCANILEKIWEFVYVWKCMVGKTNTNVQCISVSLKDVVMHLPVELPPTL